MFAFVRLEWEQRRYEEELHQWQRMGGGRGTPFGQGGPMVGDTDTPQDGAVAEGNGCI